IAAALGAEFILVENTAKIQDYPEAGRILEALAKAGYGNQLAGVLDASEQGVPQKRKRWFALAARDSSPRLKWPEPTTGGRPVTVREAFAGLPFGPGNEYDGGRSNYADLMRDHRFWRLEANDALTHHETPGQTPAMRMRRTLVRPGGRA